VHCDDAQLKNAVDSGPQQTSLSGETQS